MACSTTHPVERVRNRLCLQMSGETIPPLPRTTSMNGVVFPDLMLRGTDLGWSEPIRCQVVSTFFGLVEPIIFQFL